MSGLDLSRLYCVLVESTNGHSAPSHTAPSNDVEERLYNVQSEQECIDEGLSEDAELRLFETGWNGRVPTYIEQPQFLVAAPAALIRAWSRCPHEPCP